MKKTRMIPLAMIACLLWGSAFPTLKTLYRLLDIGGDVGVKLLLAGIRFTLAGIVILIFYIIRNKKLPIVKKGRSRYEIILLGLIQTSIMYMLFYIGVYNTTGVKSSILSQGGTFLVVVMSHFIYHDDKMHRGKVVGLIFGLLGILLVNINGLTAGVNIFEFTLKGEGFMLLCGVFSAAGTFYAKRLSRTIPPVLMTGWQLFYGGLILLVSGLIMHKEPLLINSLAIVLLLGYSVLISAGAFTLWFILLQKNKASEISMVKLSVPVFGALFSALLLEGESISVFVVIALALVAYGIFLCNKAPKIGSEKIN